MKDKIKSIISQMTLEEKASLCSGKDFWHLKGIERLGIPKIMVTDGPHGLRKQSGEADHLGLNQSVRATCFPTAATTASGWDRENLFDMGKAIGEECVQEQVSVVLGPGTNIKRSPLCGRNFEYFSEDPFLAGEMSAAWINGVQSQGIGTSLKHFAANNQEKARLVSNSVVDERALREIYLTAFEIAVKQAQPWTLMCSYNRINNVYSCENQWLINDVLRGEWGFQGLVMTDWGAMNERTKALEAGLELEMPSSGGYNDQKIVEAVREGKMKEAVLNRAVTRILTVILKAQEVKKKNYDKDQHHNLAQKIGAESIVLLKNDGMLPLNKDVSYAVIGAFAEKPRYQGAGSSKINPHRVEGALEALRNMGIKCEYAQGYELCSDEIRQEIIDEATECAAKADGAVIFAGLPDSYESEGFDRSHLDMPKNHNALIEAVVKVNRNVTVVLQCGSPVLMPWKDDVKGIVLSYLGGEAAGSASAKVLTGEVNPSGHLAETFPMSLEDTPCYNNFAKEGKDVEYRESIFVGYRYYDWADIPVLYPFGYGLSYTDFSYEGMQVEWDDDSGTGNVKVTVSNKGKRAGSEVVQLYIGKECSSVMRAPKELKGFQKVFLNPQETKTVKLMLDKRSFSYYDIEEHGWTIEDGNYQLYVAASSRDMRLKADLKVKGKVIMRSPEYKVTDVVKNGRFSCSREQFKMLFEGEFPITPQMDKISLNSTVQEVLEKEAGRKSFQEMVDRFNKKFDGEDDLNIMMRAMLKDMPLRGLAMFGEAAMGDIEKKIKDMN